VRRRVGREFAETSHHRTFHKAWTAAREKAELRDQIPHDVRRSAVRNLERAGIPAGLTGIE